MCKSKDFLQMMMLIATPQIGGGGGCDCFSRAMKAKNFNVGIDFHDPNSDQCYTKKWSIVLSPPDDRDSVNVACVTDDGRVLWSEGFNDEYRIRWGIEPLIEECVKLMALSYEKKRLNCVCDLSPKFRHSESRIQSLQFYGKGSCDFCGGTRGVRQKTWADIVQSK